MALACCGLAVSDAGAATITVANCNDSGTGSLRRAVADAGEQGVVNMPLTCTVSLQTGAIAVTQAHLTINGSGRDKLLVSGLHGGVAEQDRIFKQTAAGGYLYLNSLELDSGYIVGAGTATGGCVYSAGDISLLNVAITQCSATSSDGLAYGGAVYAKGRLTLHNSTLTGNTVASDQVNPQYYVAKGGAMAAAGDISIYSSLITANIAQADSYYGPTGAAVATLAGTLTIDDTTISGNTPAAIYSARNLRMNRTTVSGNAAGLVVGSANGPNSTVTLVNSTISTNHYGRGILVFNSDVGVANSTVAFNGGGLYVYNFSSKPVSVTMQSSIFAESWCCSDFSTQSINGAVSTSGANNLIVKNNAQGPIPSDTIATCPALGPLRNNGGPTMTHALPSHSPALDRGNTLFTGFGDLNFDQRGSPFARVVDASADIGAYELDTSETIFSAGFDGCK